MFSKFTAVGSVFLISLSINLFLVSCGGGQKENTEPDDVEVTKDTISSQVRVNFDLIRVNIPSPGELSQKLSASKIAYNKNFLLSPSSASSFSSNYQKAIGLGALASDLGFAADYNQNQDALDYLDQIKKLTVDLGISDAFDMEFSKKLLSKIGNADSFQVMFDKAFDKAERNLRSNQRVSTTILVIAGGWVEGLYTTLEAISAKQSGVDASVYLGINKHCHGFEYVFQLLDAYKSNSDCAKFLGEIEPYRATILSYGKRKWEKEELPKLRETVTALRNKIIK